MRSIKERGKEELKAVRNRVARQYGMSRISKKDMDALCEMLDEMDQYIEEMEEVDDGQA
jgi:hypothetical protein